MPSLRKGDRDPCPPVGGVAILLVILFFAIIMYENKRFRDRFD
jgi:UDP-N-acetylmuramyl pentapeptide phosphotransferase/UDP-N-acetylglucosamine-1-phosphate transferase